MNNRTLDALRIRPSTQEERDARAIESAEKAAAKLLQLRLDACVNAMAVVKANMRAT